MYIWHRHGFGGRYNRYRGTILISLKTKVLRPLYPCDFALHVVVSERWVLWDNLSADSGSISPVIPIDSVHFRVGSGTVDGKRGMMAGRRGVIQGDQELFSSTLGYFRQTARLTTMY